MTVIFLFLYINEIPPALSNIYTYLYADSTSIFYQHKDVRETGNVLNKEFANVCEWLIISCQFILVKIKLNTFFSVGEKPFRSLTYDYDRIT